MLAQAGVEDSLKNLQGRLKVTEPNYIDNSLLFLQTTCFNKLCLKKKKKKAYFPFKIK